MKATARMDRILKLTQLKNQAAIQALNQKYSSIGNRILIPLTPYDSVKKSNAIASKFNVLIDEEYARLNQELKAAGKQPINNPFGKDENNNEE